MTEKARKALLLFFAALGTVLLYSLPSFPITLDEAIATSLKNNSDFQAYRLKVRSSLMKVKEARSPFMPSLDLENTYQRSRDPITGVSDSTTSYVSLYYNIFNGGSDYYNFLSEKSGLFSQVEVFCKKGLDLIQEVKETYFECLKRKALIEARKEILESSRYHLKLAERRYALGLSNRADLMKAKVDVSEAEVNLTLAKRDYGKSLNTLSRLLGLEIRDVEEYRGKFGSYNEDKLIKKAMELPEVKEKRYAVDRYRYLVKKVRGEYLPKVDLYGNYGFKDRGYTMNPRKRFYSFGVKMDLNLFSGFSTTHRLKMYKTEEKSALLELEEEKRRVKERLKNGLLDYRASIEVYRTSVERERESREDLRVSEGRYAQGVAPFIELKDAQANFSDALTKRINAYYDVFKYEARLERSYGKYLERVLGLLDRR